MTRKIVNNIFSQNKLTGSNLDQSYYLKTLEILKNALLFYLYIPYINRYVNDRKSFKDFIFSVSSSLFFSKFLLSSEKRWNHKKKIEQEKKKKKSLSGCVTIIDFKCRKYEHKIYYLNQPK